MTEFGCPKCGRSDRFTQSVHVSIDTEVSVELVVKDGKPSFRQDLSYVDVDRHDVMSDGDVGCECGARFKDSDGLRVVVEDWQPGDVAILPDGMRGTVETVGEKLTVEGWHEEFAPRELVPLYPRPKSEPLGVLAS